VGPVTHDHEPTGLSRPRFQKAMEPFLRQQPPDVEEDLPRPSTALHRPGEVRLDHDVLWREATCDVLGPQEPAHREKELYPLECAQRSVNGESSGHAPPRTRRSSV